MDGSAILKAVELTTSVDKMKAALAKAVVRSRISQINSKKRARDIAFKQFVRNNFRVKE